MPVGCLLYESTPPHTYAPRLLGYRLYVRAYVCVCACVLAEKIEIYWCERHLHGNLLHSRFYGTAVVTPHRVYDHILPLAE